MFNSADQTPFLIAEDSIVNISLQTIHQQPENTITIAPSISTDGNITLKSADPTIPILKVEVIASDGKKVFDFNPPLAKNYVTLKLPKEAGIYYLKIIAGSKVYVKKALRL